VLRHGAGREVAPAGPSYRCPRAAHRYARFCPVAVLGQGSAYASTVCRLCRAQGPSAAQRCRCGPAQPLSAPGRVAGRSHGGEQGRAVPCLSRSGAAAVPEAVLQGRCRTAPGNRPPCPLELCVCAEAFRLAAAKGYRKTGEGVNLKPSNSSCALSCTAASRTTFRNSFSFFRIPQFYGKANPRI